MPIYTFINRKEYYKEIAEKISHFGEKDKVALSSMSYKPSTKEIAIITDNLLKATNRGAKTLLLIDAFAFMLKKGILPGPLLFNKKLPKKLKSPFKEKVEALDKIRDKGGNYSIINPPTKRFSNPFSGRSHIKFAILNDYVYIGGANLTVPTHSDIIVKFKSKNTSDYILGIAEKIERSKNTRVALNYNDLAHKIDNHTTLLIDCGVKKQSLIMENAEKIIDEAKETIFMTCQYFPDNTIVKRLNNAAKRGVNIRLIYNNPSKHDFPFNILHSFVKIFSKMKYDKKLFLNELDKKNDFLHAKILANEKECLIGSHNYITSGVNMGTAEMSISSTSGEFRKELIKKIETQIYY